MDQADIPMLLSRLVSDEDAVRKMAVFKLQSSISDPSFADVFISSGGLLILRRLVLESSGNTLAYSLQSLARLLEVDMGWAIFASPTATELVDRIVELLVTNPLVNILRGAMSILVALVSHSPSDSPELASTSACGSRALKPAVAVHPQFFELVVRQLQSADHALCASALMLVNALIRDALLEQATPFENGKDTGAGEEWATLIKHLQDLGLTKAVYKIMQGSALQDLAHPALEFQTLSKILIRRWKEVPVDPDRPDHKQALESLLSSASPAPSSEVPKDSEDGDAKGDASRMTHRESSQRKRKSLGFESADDWQDFQSTGYLGLLDLTDFALQRRDMFQKMLQEQTTRPEPDRLPLARASIAMTQVLYEHFEIEKAGFEDAKGAQAMNARDQDKLFRPLLLQWSQLHAAALRGFCRIWKVTGAMPNDFEKIVNLTRILVAQVVGEASRTKGISEIEEDMQEMDVGRLRELQMDLLQLDFEEQWAPHLVHVRQALAQEALQFVKEQRVRCLLQGSWFAKPSPSRDGRSATDARQSGSSSWRFAKLSYNRRFLHFADFPAQTAQDPTLNSLSEKIDLNDVSSVVSNVSAANGEGDGSPGDAAATKTTGIAKAMTKITIFSPAQDAATSAGNGAQEFPILSLWPANHSLASEWLDGLLMLLNQAPITAETTKMIDLVKDYGMKIRLLNVRMDSAAGGPMAGDGVVPSRDGLDEDYFYEM